MKLILALALLFSFDVFAKRDAGNFIRKVCRPTLAQCEKDRMSLAILTAKYDDIYFDLKKCRNSAGRFCFAGRLNILYDIKPTQRINMIVDQDTCNSIAKTANDSSGKYVQCNLGCSFFRKNRSGSFADILLIILFNTKRASKPFNLKGICQIKK